ncbi:hypothetical protein [Flexivirga oryzae]|uniref:Uncharacterized protein n=1 Tax=Flexivirga oryzae TaxID=1794944 RepID=A0A839NC99_9MICO|nr:hypothetical protein [Flexivirga oryzae]MBB2892815.1 hypothetical protein [Flexivirga oryzae]
MNVIVTLLWCCWAALQVVAAGGTAAGKDSAHELSRRQRIVVAAGFTLSAAAAVGAGLTRSPVSIGLAVVLGMGCPLLVGILTNSLQLRHHAGRLVVLAGLVLLTGLVT